MSDPHEIDRIRASGALPKVSIPVGSALGSRESAVVARAVAGASGAVATAGAAPAGLLGPVHYPQPATGYRWEASSSIRSSVRDGAVLGAFVALLYLAVMHSQLSFGTAVLSFAGAVAGGALAVCGLHLVGRLLGWMLEAAAWITAIGLVVFMWVAFR
jgi:hypothetical protein